ncbi:hypothetical protein CATRI_00380 [Corynebacterium atrinae]|uniref:biotin synthase auxiliary protein BsaP n=1 Tax=Corynebacterium atrinae TaxID=1336740 RepID=UPI0025B62030|nr:hypothetical protein [Corynebacterium atrinae]WJY62198.1 hypothetical protein CATRI_00380 [Corynebacterium atrinae]
MDELAAAVFTGEAPVFHPNTGAEIGIDEERPLSVGAAAGLEPPRYCQLCGRRMKVQIRPTGWHAECSRHGELDSTLLDR